MYLTSSDHFFYLNIFKVLMR